MLYLHQKNIVHRDLALRNLLVSNREDGTILAKITGPIIVSSSSLTSITQLKDFGMARSLKSEYYKTDDAVFPVKWSAPEVLNYGKFSPESDCWSFGITLWELFSFGAVSEKKKGF